MRDLLPVVGNFLRRQWFLVGLACMLTLGIWQASLLKPVRDAAWLRNCVVFIVLFCMALPLEASAMWQAVRRPWAPLIGVGVNIGLLPIFAWLVSQGLDATMASGLMVAASAPCTLASAVVWTRRGGGNDAVAILVTMITNAFCFLVTPFWLNLLTGDSVEVPVAPLITKLGLLVVLPMAIAQLLRISRPMAAWSTARKKQISIVAQTGLLFMVLVGAIQIGVSLATNEEQFSLKQITSMAIAVCIVHLTMLATAYAAAWMLNLSRADRVAVGISGSQKTLMVGLQVGVDLGITILPMVWYHVTQLLLDTLIVDYWAKQAEADEKTEEIPEGKRPR